MPGSYNDWILERIHSEHFRLCHKCWERLVAKPKTICKFCTEKIPCTYCENGQITCYEDVVSLPDVTHYTHDWKEVCPVCKGETYLKCNFCDNFASKIIDGKRYCDTCLEP